MLIKMHRGKSTQNGILEGTAAVFPASSWRLHAAALTKDD
jgi:hypothetical protein